MTGFTERHPHNRHYATIKPRFQLNFYVQYMPLFLLMVWHQRLKCWNLWGFLWLSVSPGTLHGNLLKSCLAESEEGTCIDLPRFWSRLQLQPCSPLVLLSVDRVPYEVEHVKCSTSGRCLGIHCMSEVGYLERFDEFAAFVMIEILVLKGKYSKCVQT